MRHGLDLCSALLFASAMWLAGLASGGPFLVKEGQPQAEIVISDQPTRMTKLAASEVQEYLLKISGARLPITGQPSQDVAVQVYVGKSAHTDRLGVKDDGLEYGAFRMVSGENWLVLLGRDRDFTPREPYARTRADLPQMMEKWDALTGEKWANPVGGRMLRYYSPKTGLWEGDEGGSLNAVYEFLRGLGVRWYMPGELGEIVPKSPTIELPKVDRVVRPDSAMRYLYFAFYHLAPKEEIFWFLRLGLNHGREVIGNGEVGHGSRAVHARDEVKKAHPEYYAVWGGKRETEKKGSGVPCLSAEGLIEQNVKFARAVFDIYDEPMVSVMPQDGYASVCQCDLCRGKETPERGWFGTMSDYVWAYTDRVAREVHKTHPKRWISGGAYGTYLLPPEKIDR
ncbi:MAG: DUF4838 domain-containing protein, partial [Planctomycetes bacterium]|nr:DUF4838 domain-containing protein [Planctomycetota bacterium]